MKQVKSVIATTLPDQLAQKYTKQLLADYSKQITNAVKREMPLVVKGNDKSKTIIGNIESAKIDLAGRLSVTMNIDTDLVDKGWEYFFVPHEEPIEVLEQGKFKVMTKAILNGVLMVRTPTSLNLVPYVFEQEFKEGKDYFVKNYEEMTLELVEESIYDNLPVYVFYPRELGIKFVMEDALKRGLILHESEGKGHHRFPFDVKSVPGTIDDLRKDVKRIWKLHATTIAENPLKRPTGKK